MPKDDAPRPHAPDGPRRRPAFSSRVAAVFGVSLAFLALLISGLALYVAPRGRVANVTDWMLGGLGRQAWEDLHAAAGILFAGFAVWHLLEHATVYRNLLFGAAGHRGHLAEAALALLIVGVFMLAALADLPPVGWINDFRLWFRAG